MLEKKFGKKKVLSKKFRWKKNSVKKVVKKNFVKKNFFEKNFEKKKFLNEGGGSSEKDGCVHTFFIFNFKYKFTNQLDIK